MGLHDLAVVPYPGRTDDAAGTRIQDGGVAASPYGPQGGVGPGGVGNYQITAHRTSSTEAFRMLPSLRVGQRWILGWRCPLHLRDPPHPRDVVPVASIARRTAGRGAGASGGGADAERSSPSPPARRWRTTPQGNYWSDKFKNPEHRIDKIGVLVRTVVAG